MSLSLDTLNDAYKLQEQRLERLETRMDALESSVCKSPCPEVGELRVEIADWKTDLSQCSSSKDKKINELAAEVHGLRASIDKVDSDLGTLTAAVEDIRDSLALIARGLPDWQEVTKVYQSAKSGVWFLSLIGKAVIGLAAALAAWYVITNTTLIVPK